ncbi:hypothetical protein [Oceanobacillus halotolerans]|uniref:hypothetical protein n=1 Tax=Oceanobacillus halotolerans TaxID=2663380 RepID=UPI0013DCE9A3|nr:hypothetical protein [Oceanobacillus halotolerans]
MAQPLSEQVVYKLLQKLTEEQQAFIDKFIKQSKKSKWLEVLADKKGYNINNEDELGEIEYKIDDWVLEEVLDSGYGNREYRCECGKALRYQYIVRHTKTNKVHKLGETCFENYTSLTPEIIKDIKKEFYTINLERDEILFRMRRNEITEIEEYEEIMLPELIKEQLELGIALSYKQEEKLDKLLYEKRRRQLEQDQERRRLEYEEEINKFVASLSKEQQSYVKSFDRNTIEELYDVMISANKDVKRQKDMLEDDDIPEDIKVHIKYGFPLLDQHEKRIREIKESKIYLAKMIQKNNVDISYEEVVKRHLSTLKQVREKENHIPEGLVKDWEKIQSDVLVLKKGKSIDYSSWKRSLRNLIIPIRVDKDQYL